MRCPLFSPGLRTIVLFAFLGLVACSDDPSAPGQEPTLFVAPLEGAIDGIQLIADQPSDVLFTLQLPPEIPAVSAAEVDIAATLDYVRIDGTSLPRLIARKAGRVLGRGEDLGAMAYFRIGEDAATVCADGTLYGPFTISHGASLSVDPPTATADGAALEIINTGSMTLCMTITANFDAILSVDGIAMDLEEGQCDPPADFSGVWTGTYQCSNFCGDGFGGAIELTVTQSGSQASYTDDGGATFTGRVCGSAFRFERITGEEIERGTLTLTGPGTAVKRSTWRGRTSPYCWGNCVDQLTRR